MEVKTNFCEGWLRFIIASFRASYLTMTKSLSNLWISSLMQIFFYVAQFLFWYGLSEHQNLLDEKQFHGFFVTMALVDNFYLVFFGPGSLLLQQLVLSRSLEQILTYPRSALPMLMLIRPNLCFIPCLLLSIFGFCFYVGFYEVSFLDIFTYLFLVFIGVLILNFISFIYRLSSFWTSSIVQIRHSNPSFKIMVRPIEAFHGPLRLFLMTIFPALFITGIPSLALSGKISWVWMSGACLAVLWLSLLLYWIWGRGLRRYSVRSI